MSGVEGTEIVYLVYEISLEYLGVGCYMHMLSVQMFSKAQMDI